MYKRVGLQDLPADIFRTGILSNLLHHTPKFAGHYFERQNKFEDLKYMFDLGYFAQPNNNITIYTEAEYRDSSAGPRTEIGSSLLNIFNGPLPALEIFKLAMLNKRFQQLILTIFKPLRMSHFKKFFEVMDCVDTFRTSPNFEKYKDLRRLDGKTNGNNMLIIQGFLSGYDSDTFGGSILRPIDSKQNLMYESIMKIRGTHGGFFTLYNVKDGDKLFDIEILIDWNYISSQPGFKLLLGWHECFQEVDDLKNRDLADSCIEFKALKNYLTGYARVIEVNNGDGGKVYEIRSITEGKMTRGIFDGFARKMTVNK